ncbi:hypothetical protein Q9Q99_05720 [Curtobacterium flaccumfaciens]|nr:hypothetical protein Q9Q99_05720 [Curtobacterium flaccumfaciens]
MIPLRPLGLGDVLAGAFTVFRRNARVLLLWSVLLSGVLGLLSTLASTFGQQALQSRMFSALDGGSGAGSVAAGTLTLTALMSIGLPFLAYLGRGVPRRAGRRGHRAAGARPPRHVPRAVGAAGRTPLAGRRVDARADRCGRRHRDRRRGSSSSGSSRRLGAAGSGTGWFVLALVFFVLGLGVVVVWLGIRFVFTVPTIAPRGPTGLRRCRPVVAPDPRGLLADLRHPAARAADVRLRGVHRVGSRSPSAPCSSGARSTRSGRPAVRRAPAPVRSSRSSSAACSRWRCSASPTS